MSSVVELGSEITYELVFEGPSDDSPKTLQRIKGVFVADLDLPVPEVQRILTEVPAIIRTAANEADLKAAFAKLKTAGAKVLILRKVPEGMEADEEAAAPEEENDEFSFEFDLDHEEQPKHDPTKVRNAVGPKVYSLSLDEETEENLEDSSTLPEEEKPIALDSLNTTSSLTPRNDSSKTAASSDASFSILSDDELASFHREKGLPDQPKPSAGNAPQPIALHEVDELIDSLDLNLTPTSSQHQFKEQTPDLEEDPDLTLLDVEEPVEDIATAQKPIPSMTDTALSLDDNTTEPAAPQPTVTAPKGAKSIAPPASTDLSFAVEEPSAPQQKSETPQAKATVKTAAEIAFDFEEADKEIEALRTPPPASSPSQATVETLPSTEVEKPAKTRPTLEELAARPSVDSLINEAVVTKAKISKKRKLPFDVVAPVAVGSIILAIANWVYFANPPQSPYDLSNISLPDTRLPRGLPTKVPVENFGFEEVLPERTLIASLQVEPQGLPTGSIVVTTPPQRPRTKEEIVSKVVLPPWLRRLEVRNIRFFNNDPKATEFDTQLPALAYLEYGNKPYRVGANAYIHGTREPNSSEIHIKLEVRSALLIDTPEVPFLVDKTPDGGFKVYLQQEFTARSLGMSSSSSSAATETSEESEK